MDQHAAFRAGDEYAVVDLLGRLARQATRPFPPPNGGARWSEDDVAVLVADAFLRKGGFVAAAVSSTTTDAELERYLLKVFRNVWRDRARETERSKLIDRLETILGAEADFAHYHDPFRAWRLAGSPHVVWQGDIGDLIIASRHVRTSAATRWNTSGPTPFATRTAIVAVSRAALGEAAGLVSDGDVARVVQARVPAVPMDAADAEVFEFHDETDRDNDDTGPTQGRRAGTGGAGVREVGAVDDYNDADLAALGIAWAVWASLTGAERSAVEHLGKGELAFAKALGVGRRAGVAIAASVRDKVRTATAPGQEETVVTALLRWATGEWVPNGTGARPAPESRPDPDDERAAPAPTRRHAEGAG